MSVCGFPAFMSCWHVCFSHCGCITYAHCVTNKFHSIIISSSISVQVKLWIPWERVPYLSALEVCSQRVAIQIHV